MLNNRTQSLKKVSYCRFQAFLCALSFLTRFGKAQIFDDIVFARALNYFAPVGFIIGCLLTMPIIIGHFFWPITSLESAYLWSWFYVLSTLWITCGLHHDGLADTMDAWCGAPLAKFDENNSVFWRIIKDSRLGAFGAMALIMVIGGEILAVAKHISHNKPFFTNLIPLILAPVFGRSLCIIYTYFSTPKNPSSLGGKISSVKNASMTFIHFLLIIFLCLSFGFTRGGITLIISLIFMLLLWRLAKERGGYNGDFLGMLIVCAQLIYLICI